MCAVCNDIENKVLTYQQVQEKLVEVWHSLDKYHRDDVMKLALNLQNTQQKDM